jgi:hypothetical protein
VSAILATTSQSGPLRATVCFGVDESSHLYRGVTSPNPIGVVLRSSFELAVSTPALLTMRLPEGGAFECRALLHWTSPVARAEHWLGFRLLNPSRELSAALLRIAARFPTRLYDEGPRTTGNKDDSDETCPCTLRTLHHPGRDDSDETGPSTQRTSYHPSKDAPASRSSRQFAVVDSSCRVDFDELRRSGPVMRLACDGDDVTSA